MRLGESLEREQVKVADVFVRKQVRQEIIAFVVPYTGGRLGALAGDDLELRIRRIAGEIFVGIDLFVRWVINGNQLHRVEIDDFLHRFHEAETENAALSRRTRENWAFKGLHRIAV